MAANYPSKVMLFGEYAILSGGEALAIPWPAFSAQWTMDAKFPSEYQPHLQRFADWLLENNFRHLLDVDAFRLALEGGLDLDSNIPVGYGVGSSGAVVAAVYDRYSMHPHGADSIAQLREDLSAMENFFHSKSSGIDPLVCLLQKPVHIKGDMISVITDPLLSDAFYIELINCGSARFTHALVENFQQRCTDDAFRNTLQEYLDHSNACIRAWLLQDITALYKSAVKLSAWQLQNFDFAIPEYIKLEWRNALKDTRTVFKLCGAGGGGFVLRLHFN